MKILTMLILITMFLVGVSEGTQTTVTVRVKSLAESSSAQLWKGLL